jgi:hypothetical protein
MANDENFMPLGIKPYVVDDAYAEVDDFSRYMENRLGKSIDEIDGDFVKLAKRRMIELVKINGRVDAIAYTLTKGGKISKSKNNLPYVLGANFNESDIKKIKEMGNQEFTQVKHIATLSRKRTESEEVKLKKAADKANRAQLLKTRGQQFASVIGENVFGSNLKAFKLSEEKAHLADLKKQFLEVDEGSESFERLKGEIAGSRREINKLQKSMETSSAEKFFKFFKRMGMSRILFSTWSRIISDMGASIKSLAETNPEYNKLFSSINSDISKISASIVSVVAPLTYLLQPVVSFISDAVVNIAAGLSKITSLLVGQNSVLKVNKDYYKDINEQASKFSFDKFEALSGGSESLFDPLGGDGSELDETQKSIYETLRLIGELLLVFGTYKFFKWIYDGGMKILDKDLNNAFSSLDGGAKKSQNAFQKMYDKINPIYLAIMGISMAIDGIVDIVNWDETTSGLSKTLDILKLVFGVVAAIAGIVAAFTTGGAAKIAKAIAFSATIAGTATIAVEKIGKFADGGIPTQGTLFYAGEAGAEIVHTMPGGQTGVTNIEQFTQAMINANYQSAGLFQNLIESALYNCSSIFETNIDGASLARSKSFKNEINRTNSSLNLR